MGTGKLACFARWATLPLVLFAAGRAISQEPPHPGLEPGQGNSEQNPKDAPIGLRWNWHPVFANRYMGLIAICIPPPHTLPEGRTWEIASTAPDWNMLTTNGHAQGLCIQVRHADFTIPDGSPFTVTVSERENGQIVESHTYYFKLYVFGGPLLRGSLVQHAEDPKIVFNLHPKRYVLPGYSGPDSEKEIFPNYCTDFNYNPHEFRAIADFKENVYSQKVNVFKFRPECDQPAKVRIWYSLDEPGVFVNYRDSQQIEELNSEGGPAGLVNPRLTKGLPWTSWAKIASAPVVGSPDNTFTLVATYAYVSSVTAAEPVDGLPPAGVVDDTRLYYRDRTPPARFVNLNHQQFTDFRTHRPKDDLLLNTDGMTPWTPPAGYSGGVLFYRLLDHEGLGMPGVWIQERFGAPEEIPDDCRVHTQRTYWVTQRKGEKFPVQASWENFELTTYPPFFPNGTADHGVFGPDYLWVANYHISGNEFLIHKHEYWAGTRATISNAGGTGPGIKLGSYTIRIVLNGGVTQIREDGG